MRLNFLLAVINGRVNFFVLKDDLLYLASELINIGNTQE